MPAIAFPIRAEIGATVALAAPLAGANLAQMAMGLTNAVAVGRLGGGALAASGLGAGVYFTLVMICQGVLVAVAPLAAHALGAKDEPAAARFAGAGMLLALLLAFPVFALLTVAPEFLVLLGYQEKLAADIAEYLSAIRWGSPAFLIFVVLRAMLSAASRARPIMAVLLLGVPANAVLNWALVFGHLDLPALGIVGSGCATAIVQWLMALALGAYMLIVPSGPKLRFRTRPGEFMRIVRVGLPIGGLLALEVGVFNATGMLMGLFGADALGAHQLALNFASLTFMAPLGIAQAATVRVAFELGRGERAAARRAGFVALALGGTLMLAPSVLMLLFPLPIAGIYLDLADPGNQGTAAVAVQLLAIAAVFQVFDGVQVIAVGALRGYRDTAVPMLIAAFGYWVAGFAASWAFAFPLGYGAAGLWWGLVLGLGIVAVLLTVRFQYRSRVAASAGAVIEPQPLPG